MKSTLLAGKRVAILVTDGFEQVELTRPREALDDAGAQTSIISPKRREVRGWKFTDWGDKFPVDTPLASARPEEYDALLLPGGVINPDSLRIDDDAIAFVRHFVRTGKPIAAICHGPWTLIEAGGVTGKTMTSWPSIKNDLQNAGATWVDQEVVVEPGLVTSRKPDDIPAFNRAILVEFGQPPRTARSAA
jgi:protease I